VSTSRISIACYQAELLIIYNSCIQNLKQILKSTLKKNFIPKLKQLLIDMQIMGGGFYQKVINILYL